MVDKRYQIFISTSGEQMSAEYRLICQTLVAMGYFVWGVEKRCEITTTLARRQIDECDYVLLLLGDDYGQQSMSGVSYVQLEYIYALARQKPIIVFMRQKREVKNEPCPAGEMQKRFNNFRELIQQDVKDVFEYNSLDNLVEKVQTHISVMLARYPTQGWVRAYNTRLLQDEIQRLKNQVRQFELQFDTQNQSTMSYKPIQLSDVFALDYQVYAYENESFEIVVRTLCLTWLEIIKILGKVFVKPQSEDAFAHCLNQHLMQSAWQILSKENPHLSHITNVAIHARALYLIKLHVKQSHWIIPIGRDQRQRTLWQVSHEIRNILKKII